MIVPDHTISFIRMPSSLRLDRLVRSHLRKLGNKSVKGKSLEKKWIEQEQEYREWFNNRYAITPETEFEFVQSVRFYDQWDLTVEDANNTQERGSDWKHRLYIP